MPHTVHNNCAVRYLEQNTIVANSQAIFRSKVGKLLDVASQVVSHSFDLFNDLPSKLERNLLQVFHGTGLKTNLVFHFL